MVDTLSHLLRILDDVVFLRQRLREQLAEGVGVFEGSFQLLERKRVRQIEDYRAELRSTLDSMVDKVTLQ